MNLKRITICGILAMACASSVLAGGSIKTGTSASAHLLVPIGARGLALGGAMIADARGVEAVYWNPAGVVSQPGTEAMFYSMPLFADMTVNFFGVSTEVGELGTFAVAAKIFDAGDIEVTTTSQPGGTGAVISPSFSVIGLTFSRQMSNMVSFGVTANLLSERIDRVTANGFSFDMGFIYEPGWNGMKLGLVIKNIGSSMSFGGEGLSPSGLGNTDPLQQLTSISSELPSYANIALSYSPPTESEHSFTFSGNFQSNNFSEDNWIGGVEYNYNDLYFLRGAYNYSSQDDYAYGMSVGAGLTLNLNETLVTIEGAWRETEFFESDVVFSAKLNF